MRPIAIEAASNKQQILGVKAAEQSGRDDCQCGAKQRTAEDISWIMYAIIDAAIGYQQRPGCEYIFQSPVSRWQCQDQKNGERKGIAGMAGNKTVLAAGTGGAKMYEGRQRCRMRRPGAANPILDEIRRQLVTCDLQQDHGDDEVPGRFPETADQPDGQREIERDPKVLVTGPVHDHIEKTVVFPVEKKEQSFVQGVQVIEHHRILPAKIA